MWLRHLLGWMVSAFSSREDLVLENLALRQQLLSSARQTTSASIDRPAQVFWVALRTFWAGWTKPLVLVTPRTVVSWHRAGFRLYWTWVSRARQVGGRKRVSKEACGPSAFNCPISTSSRFPRDPGIYQVALQQHVPLGCQRDHHCRELWSLRLWIVIA